MEALRVTQTIMDEYSARTLLGTFDRPASAIDLGRRFGIPITACYRRIKELEGLGLVYCARAESTRNGRGPLLYRSRLNPSESHSRTGRFEPASSSARWTLPRGRRTRSPNRS